MFDQTLPWQLRFISFGFCTLFIHSGIIFFVCFVSAELKPSIPAPPETAEELEESEGKFARGPNEARTRWKKRWKMDTEGRDIVFWSRTEYASAWWILMELQVLSVLKWTISSDFLIFYIYSGILYCHFCVCRGINKFIIHLIIYYREINFSRDIFIIL